MEARTDKLGDPLPKGAVARMGSLRWRHLGHVDALAWSPDGKLVASAGDGLRILDAATGRTLERLARGKNVKRVAFTDDGHLLATVGEDGAVSIYNVLTWRVWKELALPCREAPAGTAGRRWATAGAFAPSGQRLALAVRPCVVQFVDVALGQEGAEQRVAPDIYSEHVERGADPTIRDLAFSLDGRTLVAATADARVRFWDPASPRRPTVELPIDAASVAIGVPGLAFSERHGEHVRLFGLGGNEIAETRAPDAEQLAFSPGTPLLGCLLRDALLLWDLEKRAVRRLEGERRAFAFSPDGKKVASAALDGDVFLHATDGTELVRHATRYRSVAVAPDSGDVACGTDDGRVQFFTREGEERRVLAGHSGAVTGLAFSPQGDLAVASTGSAVRIREATGKLLFEIDLMGGARGTTRGFVRGLAFSPDGNLLAMTGPAASFFDLAREEGWVHPRLQFPGVTSVAWKRTGHCAFLVGRFSGPFSTLGEPIQLVEPRGRRKKPVVLGQGVAFALSAAGETAISLPKGGGVRLVEAQKTLEAGLDARVLFSPDGRRLVTANGRDEVIRIYSVPDGTPLMALEGHEKGAVELAFSRDGKLLATLGACGTVLVFGV